MVIFPLYCKIWWGNLVGSCFVGCGFWWVFVFSTKLFISSHLHLLLLLLHPPFFISLNPLSEKSPSSSSPSLCMGSSVAAMGMVSDSKFHVLAVDDSVIDRKLIERLLKTSSYQGMHTGWIESCFFFGGEFEDFLFVFLMRFCAFFYRSYYGWFWE